MSDFRVDGRALEDKYGLNNPDQQVKEGVGAHRAEKASTAGSGSVQAMRPWHNPHCDAQDWSVMPVWQAPAANKQLVTLDRAGPAGTYSQRQQMRLCLCSQAPDCVVVDAELLASRGVHTPPVECGRCSHTMLLHGLARLVYLLPAVISPVLPAMDAADVIRKVFRIFEARTMARHSEV